MFTYRARPRRTWAWMLTAPLLASFLLAVLFLTHAAPAGAQPTKPGAFNATISRVITDTETADRALAARVKALNRCRRAHHGHMAHCKRAKRAVKQARSRLAAARRHAALLGIPLASAGRVSTTKAPKITVSGDTLSWNSVGGVLEYKFVRKVPGHEDEYSVVKGTSITPPAVPGVTVRYSVRTNVEGSLWAPEVWITYPSEPAPTPVPPAPAPVETTPTPTPAPTPTETPSTSGGPFEAGIVAGSALSYELPFIHKLGAHTARMEFEIGTPASQMAPIIEEYASAGIRPLLLAGFYGRLPSPAEAQNVASWAAEFGPNGNFWKGKSFPAGTAVADIEFGNETSYSYQFSTNTQSAIESRAQTYALRFKEAYEAVHAANPNVGLLAQGDPGNDGQEWENNMFKAVPNLGQMVAGWSVHPYGTHWESVMNNVISYTQADGAPSTIPMYVTEWGLASDNGICLDGNYGWNACMTYAEAATTLSSTVSAMRSTYGSRLASLYVYQAHDQSAVGLTTSFGHYFGALQSNGEAKGAYTTTVESLLSSNP